MTDEELISGFLKGGKREYSQILGWISSMVRSSLWKDRVAPEDIISDSTMKLLLSLQEGSFRRESSLKTYIQRITLNTLVDAVRRQKRFEPLHEDRAMSDSANPLSLMERDEEKVLVDRAMAMLPEGCRQLFEMVLQEKLRGREIAERLETTEGAIKTRMSRCRDKIGELLRRIS